MINAVLAPRVVAVTGAGQGIGRALASGLARRGHRVAALSRSKPVFDDPAILALAVDVADHAATAAAFAEVADSLGPVEVLVANAAIYRQGWFLDQPADEFAAHFRTNVEGVANCSRAVLPAMLGNNRGSIIVLGSLADMNPLPGTVAYAASKGALHALIKGIANEIDPRRYPGVMVNEFNPGATQTQMSGAGKPPEDVLHAMLPLIEAEPGGPHGRVFAEGREIFLGESWKGAIKRRLGLRR